VFLSAPGGSAVTPYYDSGGVTIYHGDCRDVLPLLPSVRLVVTDPPYVFGIAWGDLMNSSIWYESWLAEAKRLTANLQGACWVFNSWRSFPVLARAAYGVSWPVESLLVWDKEWIGPGGSKGLRPSYEVVALFAHRDFALKNRGLPDIWRSKWSSTKPSGHPAEKPVPLLRKLIHESGGGDVLDPFMGSGSILVAAKAEGHKAIGIEVEERYCEIAVRRLQQNYLSWAEGPSE
jgi:DNA modification methylase